MTFYEPYPRVDNKPVDPYAPVAPERNSYDDMDSSPSNSHAMSPYGNTAISTAKTKSSFRANPWRLQAIFGAVISAIGMIFMLGTGFLGALWNGNVNPFEAVFNVAGPVIFILTATFSAMWSKASARALMPLDPKTALTPIAIVAVIASLLSLLTGPGAIILIPFIVLPGALMLAVPTLIGFKIGDNLGRKIN